MKVLLLNGSRREKGCTYTALSLVAKELEKAGIHTEIVYIGLNTVNGKLDELVKECAAKIKEADGLVVGSPVYYASPTGEIQVFLDRFAGVAGADLRHKPAAAIASARRAGTSTTLDVLNKYLMYNEMPVVSSNYWNMVHGNTPEEVLQDKEGVQIMETLGKNMAWSLKCLEAGKKQEGRTGQTGKSDDEFYPVRMRPLYVLYSGLIFCQRSMVNGQLSMAEGRNPRLAGFLTRDAPLVASHHQPGGWSPPLKRADIEGRLVSYCFVIPGCARYTIRPLQGRGYPCANGWKGSRGAGVFPSKKIACNFFLSAADR